ncbi:MAG: 6-phosphofructokinase, partial [Acidobacteriota bacterium]
MPESSLGPLPSVGDVRVDRVVGALDLPTPLAGRARFTEEADRVLAGETLEDLAPALAQSEAPPSFEIAGARRRIAFDPATTTAGIVTCGGLCPGINNVIRALVLTLHHGYGIHRIFGYRYGFAGIADAGDVPPPYQLTPELVEPIHARGGSVLGSSRGPQDVAQMVDRLQEASVDLLFTIGGDGTLRGAHALAREIERRRAALAVVGVPKTIDNDIRWIDRSFGFATAVGEARHA